MNAYCRSVILTLLTITPAFADDLPTYTLEGIVVTATRTPEAVGEVIQPTTVITAKDIKNSGQQTLVELLQTRGGVEISSNGGFGQPSSVFMRGTNSDHILVLVDGMRMDSATTGTTAFENIPLNQIERIEIVPGPISSLYVSEAIGGVIQIFMKSGRYNPGPSVSVEFGSYGTRTTNVGINSTVNNTDFSVNVGYFETDGFDATKPSIPFGLNNLDKDGHRNSNLSAKMTHHFSNADEVGITMFQSEGNTHFDSGPTTDDVNHQTLSTYSAYSRNQINPVWNSLIRFGIGQDHSVVVGAFPGYFRTDQSQVTWQNDFKLRVGLLALGIEYLDQKVSSDTVYTKTDRSISSLFGSYNGEWHNNYWQISARQDDNSQFGNRTNWTFGYAYKLLDGLKLRGSGGTAFKAPTFNDLYYPGFSNPNLLPEQSRSREIGLDYQTASQHLGMTYFENKISDLIVFDPVTFVPQNLAQARIHGIEISCDTTVLDNQIKAQLTLQYPVDEATGQLLQRRSRERGKLTATRSIGSWRVGAEFIATGERFDSNTEDPMTRMGGYGLLNLTGEYKLAKDWSINIRWNNIFNKDYELAQFYNTPRGNIFLSLRWEPH